MNSARYRNNGQVAEPGKNMNCSLVRMGSLGAFLSATVVMGCCQGLLAPLAAVTMIVFPFLTDPTFQMPTLYSTVGLTLIGLVMGYRRYRSPWYLILGFAGAIFLLIPFHTALEVDLFYIFIGLGLGGLLLASWVPFVSQFLRVLRRKNLASLC